MGPVTSILLLPVAVLGLATNVDPGPPPPTEDPWADPGYDPGFDPGGDPGFVGPGVVEGGVVAGDDTWTDPGYDPALDPGGDPGYDPALDPGGDPTLDDTWTDPGYDPTLDDTWTDPGYDPGFDPAAYEPPPSFDTGGSEPWVPGDTEQVAPEDELTDAEREVVRARMLSSLLPAFLDELITTTHLGLLDANDLGEVSPLALLDVRSEADLQFAEDLLIAAEDYSDQLALDALELGIDLPDALFEATAPQGTLPRDPDLFVDASFELLEELELRVDDLVELYGLQPDPPAAEETTGEDEDDVAPAVASAPPSSQAPPPTTPGDGDDAQPSNDGDGSGSLPLILGGIVIAALAVGAALLSTRARRDRAAGPVRSPADPDADADALVVQAGRQLAASLDEDRIAEVAVDTLVTVVGAHDARLAPADETEEPAASAIRTGAASRRQVDGQPVLAVPCVGEGRVVGVLVAVAPHHRDAERLMTEFAAFVGPALSTAARHGSAVDVDGLTQIFNRRRLDRDLARISAERRAVSLVMVDVDHFKRFNDTHGHAAGDEVLRSVATVMADRVRPGDVVYRYGGEEFSILLAETTADEAAEVADRVRAAVAATDVVFDGEVLPRVTISAGVAASHDGAVEGLHREADGALYAAKEAGRDRVEIAG